MSSRPSSASTTASLITTTHLDPSWTTSPSAALFRPNNAAIWPPSSSPASSSNNSHTMPGNTGSDDSSTPDFAFEPPSMAASSSAGPAFDGSIKTPSYPSSTSNFTPTSFAYPSSMGYSSASSFSSTSGSATGTSFSSVDALPAISRDFARPSSTETRRPATAGGALQSSFGMVEKRENKPETIDEHTELFTDPFATNEKDDSIKLVPSQTQAQMDPHYVAPARRASEPHFAQPLNIQTHWAQPSVTPDHSANPSPHQPFALTSAPPNISQFGLMTGPNIHTTMQNANRQQSMAYTSRPQTSDGIPSYGHINPNGVSLPSARTITNQLPSPSYAPQSAPYFGQQGMMPYRDNRAASMGDIHGHPNNQFPGSRHYSMSSADRYPHPGQVDGKSELTFVPLGGPTPKKRPRRRYDEIERLYLCGWNGCEKAYGTLNHLNAHVAMQKHGDKRLPSEFKDMRKQWRKKKRDQAAAAANAQYMATTHTWNPRQSISSSESDFDRRDSTTSNFSIGSEYAGSHRGSVVYGGGYQSWGGDSSRPTTGSSVASSTDGRFVPIPPSHGAYAHGMINPSPAVRRPSAPGHMAIPPQTQAFRPEDHATPTQQNPYPRPGSANPVAQFPFQSLTTPMPMMAGSATGQGGQFAFQR